MHSNRRTRIVALLGLAALAGCQDLDVTNPNNPDRVRATTEPSTVQALVEGSFRQFWEWTHDDSPIWVLSTVADEFSSAFGDFGIRFASSEPRTAWNNSPLSGDREANEDPWYGTFATISRINSALIAIDSGVVITEGTDTVTARARAVGKLVHGIAYGHLALWYDRAYVVDETVALDTVRALEYLPYATVMDSAVSYLEQAIAIAGTSEFTLPADGWLHQEMDQEGLARLAHSYIARFTAGVARTRAERDAVNWQRVLEEVDAGVVEDFAPTASPEQGLIDDFKRVAARSRPGIPGDFARVDYWLVGPADSTNGFINWVNTPVANRTVFQLRTADQRIHPTGNPAGKGRYIGYTTSNRFASDRGTYHQSRYYFHRFGEGNDWQTGPQEELTVAEMRLLKAEALLRLNRADEAVPLVNVSRAAAGLPDVTTSGPPEAASCVPRKLSGACGSLWDALRYEKRIETIGVNGTLAFTDARGWQTLVENSFIHFPVPGRELAVRKEANYTFGGGEPGSAPAPDPERCPVALPRCP